MSPMGFPWTALMMAMQPQRSHQIAWFVYGWVEREHILNVRACADWWMRAMGLSAAQCMAARQGIGNTLRQIGPQVLVPESDRAEVTRQRSPRQVGRLS